MKQSEINKETLEEIEKTYKEFSSIRKTREDINKRLNMTLTFQNVRNAVKWLIDEVKELKNLNNNTKSNPKYSVNETSYIFYLKREDSKWNKIDKEYSISIDVVNNIFKDYSKHWKNMSWEEILQKYSLKPEVWNMLKNRLRLFKSSNTISPIALERASETKLNEYVDTSIDEHIQDRYKTKFINSFEKKKNKDYIAKSKILANIDNTLEHIEHFLIWYIPRQLDLEVVKIDNNDEIDVIFSDIHLWKTGSEEVLKRVKEMTDDLINRKEKIIHLMCLWDIFENLAKWWMHIWQVEDMDWPHWFELLMKGVSLLEEMLLKLYKAWKEVKFYWIWGNHDRFTKNKDDGFAWMWAYIAYELVKRWLANIKIEINILKDTWNVLDLDEVRYILHHWDNGVAKKAINNWAKILWEYWDSNKYNIIATWDQHHLEMNNNSDKSLWLIAPALAWKNTFDSKIWLSSNPWYLIIKRNKTNKPKIIFNQF